MIDDLHRRMACILRAIYRRYYMEMSEPFNQDIRAALEEYDAAVFAETDASEQASTKLLGVDDDGQFGAGA